MVYVVLREGEVVFASEDWEDAEGYAESKGFEARAEVLDEWGIDDPSEKDVFEADWQAGFDGDCYEVEAVDLSNLTEDDKVIVSDGTEIDVSDILTLMAAGDDDDDDFDADDGE